MAAVPVNDLGLRRVEAVEAVQVHGDEVTAEHLEVALAEAVDVAAGAEEAMSDLWGARERSEVASSLRRVKAAGFTRLAVTPSLVHQVQLQREPLERSRTTSIRTSPQRQVPWCFEALGMTRDIAGTG